MNKYFYHRLREYIKYLGRAKSVHRLHSPFLFEFHQEVLTPQYRNPEIEALRKSLKNSTDVIDVLDLGAGSTVSSCSTRQISAIAKSALKHPVYASLIYQMIRKYQYQNIVELGTSLGITSLYMQDAATVPVKTIEGSPKIYEVAVRNFSGFENLNPQALLGNFDDILPDILLDIQGNFLLYIDGNHTYDATMRYFSEALPHISPYSAIIFDDIYWSPEMTKAWDEIKKHPSVDLSIDLYQLGIVFFNPDIKEKQDFTLLFRHRV